MGSYWYELIIVLSLLKCFSQNGDPSMFMALLRDSSPEVTLEVFSLKGQITRKVNIKINSDGKFLAAVNDSYIFFGCIFMNAY